MVISASTCCGVRKGGIRMAYQPVLPEIDEVTEPFWRSGQDGMLRFQHCRACGWWIHPPRPRCPKCQSNELQFDPVEGRAKVWSFTINYQAWAPDLEVPYAIAIVEFPEQVNMRMTTKLVDVSVDDVSIGMEVRVVFEPVDDIYLPFFTPIKAA